MEIIFNGKRMFVASIHYLNGARRLQVYDDDYSPFMTASCYHPSIPEEYIGIKNWNENEGILDALIDAGIVSRPVAEIPTGYKHIDVCKYLGE